MSTFDPEHIQYERVSPTLIKVRLVTAVCWLALVLVAFVPLAVFLGGPWVTALLAVTAAVLALGAWLAWLLPRQVRAIGYCEQEDDLIIRSGIMFKKMRIVPYGRMQFVDVKQGPLERWGAISTVKLHTASMSSEAKIPGLPIHEAGRLRDRLTERGEARLAGL